LPVVLMEALALGRPVVTTYVAGIPELVTDQVCGWLVPAGSVDRLARAIGECLDVPDSLIQAMGEAGREQVLEQHDIVRECRKLAALFKAGAFERPAPFDSAERVEDLADAYDPAFAGSHTMRLGEAVTLRSGHSGWVKR